MNAKVLKACAEELRNKKYAEDSKFQICKEMLLNQNKMLKEKSE